MPYIETGHSFPDRGSITFLAVNVVKYILKYKVLPQKDPIKMSEHKR